MLGDLKDVSFTATDPKFLPILESVSAQGIPAVSIFLSGRPLVVNRQINASDAFIAAWLPLFIFGLLAFFLLRNAKR